MRQLTLGVQLDDEATFDNFYGGEAQCTSDFLRYALTHPQDEPFVYLWGGQAVGKTHLLQACCHVAHDTGDRAIYLPLADIASFQPDVLAQLETMDLVCLDDLQGIAKTDTAVETLSAPPPWEEAVFDLYNRLREHGTQLVVTADRPAATLPLHLRDLRSRLQWGTAFALPQRGDDEKVKILLLRAQRRGLHCVPQAAVFLLNHYHRDLCVLMQALDELDHASLRERRRLTVPFIKEVLNIDERRKAEN